MVGYEAPKGGSFSVDHPGITYSQLQGKRAADDAIHRWSASPGRIAERARAEVRRHVVFMDARIHEAHVLLTPDIRSMKVKISTTGYVAYFRFWGLVPAGWPSASWKPP